MTSKNYGLLRPFDMEAAKRGEIICAKGGGGEWQYVAGPDSNGNLCLLTSSGTFIAGNGCSEHSVRMAPLCWVEEQPVYKGDKLWHTGTEKWITAYALGSFSVPTVTVEGDPAGYHIDSLTWEAPKVKREGWINVYPTCRGVGGVVGGSGTIWATEAMAIQQRGENCESTIRIEWESQA